jgi:membrane protein YdbS with pleckstrin-like domain
LYQAKSEDQHTVLGALVGIAFITAIALYLVGPFPMWECISAGVIVFLCGVLGLFIV